MLEQALRRADYAALAICVKLQLEGMAVEC